MGGEQWQWHLHLAGKLGKGATTATLTQFTLLSYSALPSYSTRINSRPTIVSRSTATFGESEGKIRAIPNPILVVHQVPECPES